MEGTVIPGSPQVHLCTSTVTFGPLGGILHRHSDGSRNPGFLDPASPDRCHLRRPAGVLPVFGPPDDVGEEVDSFFPIVWEPDDSDDDPVEEPWPLVPVCSL